MNTKQVIALAALTLAGTAAMAQQVGAAVAPLEASQASTQTATAANTGSQIVTVRAASFRGFISETEGLPSFVFSAPSTLTRAQVEGDVISARNAGQVSFVDEVQGTSVAQAPAAKSTLTRADVMAQSPKAARDAFVGEYLPG